MTTTSRVFLTTTLVACVALFATAHRTLAANFGLTASQPINTNWNSPQWDDLGTGPIESVAPTAGNDYFSQGFSVRTPTGSSPANFIGDTLTLNGGALGMKTGFSNGVGTASVNVIFNGGTLSASTGTSGGGVQYLAGTADFMANTSIRLAGTTRRRIGLRGMTLTGSGDATISGGDDANDLFFLNGSDGSAHTGDWEIQNVGRLLIAGSTNNIGDTSGVTLTGTSTQFEVRGVETIGALDGTGLVRVGYNGQEATLNVVGGNVNLTDLTTNFEVGVSRSTGSSDGNTTQATADFSAATGVLISAGSIQAGTIPGNTSDDDDTQGIITLSTAGANSLTSNSLFVGDSPVRGNNTFTSELHFGGSTNTVQSDLIVIGGRKARGTADIAAGGSLNIVDTDASLGQADLRVGWNVDGNTGVNGSGVLDLSGGNMFSADLDEFWIGVKGNATPGTNTGDGKTNGRVTLADTDNTIKAATSIIVGRSGNSGATAGADQSQLHLGGGTNTITTPNLIVGQSKTTGVINFAAPGGTLDLGTAGNRAEITLGWKDLNTGTSPTGTMDVGDGTANIFASDVNLGSTLR